MQRAHGESTRKGSRPAMGKQSPKSPASGVHRAVPFLHVADVEASVAFYALLGLDENHVLRGGDGGAFWGHVWGSGAGDRVAEVMFAKASDPVVPEQQAVLLYMYTTDLKALRKRLLAGGVSDGGAYCGQAGPNKGRRVVFEISHPDYMDEGEIRVADPDGYCILVGQHEGWPDR